MFIIIIIIITIINRYATNLLKKCSYSWLWCSLYETLSVAIFNSTFQWSLNNNNL